MLSRRILSAISLTLFHLPLAFGSSCDLTKRANVTKTEAEIWGGINPTKDLVWHPCYPEAGTFECARLTVPLDYSDPGGREAAIALIRKPATTQEGYRGPILFNPGGPGGSGVEWFLAVGNDFATILGPQFDIVSFDPRDWFADVAVSTRDSKVNPRAVHFDTDVERVLFSTSVTGSFPLVKDGKVTNAERIWAAYQVLGSLAASHDDGYLKHITTENTATDMLSIVQAYGQEKLQYLGFSYGTVLGATFAALYPDKIERMVLDGVVDSEDYYASKSSQVGYMQPLTIKLAQWLTALLDTNKTLQLFFDNCAEAGPTECAFYAADPSDIQRNLTALQDKLLIEPVPVKTDAYYGIIDRAALEIAIFMSLYVPYALFKPLAGALAQLAAGNGTALLSMFGDPETYTCSCDEHAHDWDGVLEGQTTVACNDGAEVPKSLKQLQKYWDGLAGISPFATYVGIIRAGCTNWPRNKKPFSGPFVGNTSHPILLIGNTADPITPLASAKKMAQGFKDSVVLTIDAGGHCSLNAPSICAQQYIRQYFQAGTLPEEGTVCDPIFPNSFLVPASLLEGSSGASGSGLVGRQDVDVEFLAAVQDVAGKVGSGFRVPGTSKSVCQASRAKAGLTFIAAGPGYLAVAPPNFRYK
ncbi:hypothetical protein FA13DRAFT_1707039 [Coprinellus micaceus]|uniref:Alpha/beta-hydrolase n=1 Tax=Coprinellus micaceus TaxID=71717 RepID=A0A4Y7TKV0_COPMI|nr:hypothetical protein FA13DRAFT_1707039 [Coprinellus micaceus]